MQILAARQPAVSVDPDSFATALEERMSVPVAPPAHPPVDAAAPTSRPQGVGRRIERDPDLIVAADGRQLSIFKRHLLGQGTYAKVHAGMMVARHDEDGVPVAQLVAVKKARLSCYRAESAMYFAQKGEAELFVQRRLRDDFQQESRWARQALSPAAPSCVIVTAKQTYMVMPLFAATLQEFSHLLAKRPAAAGIDRSTWTAYLLGDLLPQIDEAATRGVVHHDISPHNIMLRGRHAAFSDFGFACAPAPDWDDIQHGTVWCAAPEILSPTSPTPPDLVACEYFSLGMAMLAFAAGGPGETLANCVHQALEGPRKQICRAGYVEALNAWRQGRPAPLASGCGEMVRRLRAAADTLDPCIRGVVVGLLDPVPAARRRHAEAAGCQLRLGERPLARVQRELDAIGAMLGHRLADHLTADPRGTAKVRRGGGRSPAHGATAKDVAASSSGRRRRQPRTQVHTLRAL